jgi:hypothetical protein
MNEHIWVIIRENGEHYLLEKAPLEGFDVWAKGQKVTVLEYTYSGRIYPKPEAAKR